LTEIPEAVLIKPKVFGDSRGYFMESFRSDLFIENIGDVKFIQDNESKSAYGVLRGLHYQLPPYAQAKLVRVITGRILDVAVDIRRNSPTFGRHVKSEISEDNKHQLFIPQGFAHGFVVLSDEAIVSYKVDAPYAPDHEAGIHYADPALGIDWGLAESEIRLSDKDGKWPGLGSRK
jgi:dTDP-4-dehydrorhamnose 3,5-epimerase